MSRYQVDSQGLRDIDEVPGSCDFVTYQNDRERAVNESPNEIREFQISPRPGSTGPGCAFDLADRQDRASSSLMSGSIEHLSPVIIGANSSQISNTQLELDREEMLAHEDNNPSSSPCSFHPEDNVNYEGHFIKDNGEDKTSGGEGHFESDTGSSQCSYRPEDDMFDIKTVQRSGSLLGGSPAEDCVDDYVDNELNFSRTFPRVNLDENSQNSNHGNSNSQKRRRSTSCISYAPRGAEGEQRIILDLRSYSKYGTSKEAVILRHLQVTYDTNKTSPSLDPIAVVAKDYKTEPEAPSSSLDACIDGYIRTFNEMDLDKNGVINYEEFREICTRIGLHTDDEFVKEMFYQADLNGDDCLALDEFVQLQFKYATSSTIEEVEEALKVFDQGGGCFTRTQIKRILTKVGEKMDPAEADEILSYIPFNERNEVQYDTLMNLMADCLECEEDDMSDTTTTTTSTPLPSIRCLSALT